MYSSVQNDSNLTAAIDGSSLTVNMTFGVGIRLLIVVLAVVGLVGNGLVLVVYGKKRRKTCPHYFIMTLAANDFFICVVILPYFLYSHSVANFTNANACRTFTYMWFVSIANSLMITWVIAVDRYYAICRPLDFTSTPKKAKIVIVACSIASLLLAIPVFFMYGISYRDRYGVYLYMCDYVCDPKLDLIFYRVFFALYCVCVVSTLVLYTKIILTVRSKTKLRKHNLGLQTSPDRRPSLLSSTNMSVYCNGKGGTLQNERRTSNKTLTKQNHLQQGFSFDSTDSDRAVPSQAALDDSDTSYGAGSVQAPVAKRDSLHRVSTTETCLGQDEQETTFVVGGGDVNAARSDKGQDQNGNSDEIKSEAANEDASPRATPPRRSLKRYSQASRLSWAAESPRQGSTSTTSGGSRRGNVTPTARSPRQRKAHSLTRRAGLDRTVLMLMLVTLVFIVSWIPIFVFSFIPGLNWRNYDTYPSPVKYLVFLYFMNNLLNPFIYSFVNKKFRRNVISVLKSFRCTECFHKISGQHDARNNR